LCEDDAVTVHRTAGWEGETMRDEDMVILYTDSTGKCADCRLRLITTGTSWQAVYRFLANGETKKLSGVGSGPDVFALAREALAEEQRESASQARAKAAGFTILQGGAA
jgi:hypothetical protein